MLRRLTRCVVPQSSNESINCRTPPKKRKPFIFSENLTKRKSFQLKTDLLCQPVFITEVSEVRVNRARMVDWMLEVCDYCQLSWSTYWSAVSLLDLLILEHGFVRVDNIHLVGTVSLFMSSKIHDTNHLRLNNVVEDALHRSYSREAVLDMEMKILMKASEGIRSMPIITIF